MAYTNPGSFYIIIAILNFTVPYADTPSVSTHQSFVHEYIRLNKHEIT